MSFFNRKEMKGWVKHHYRLIIWKLASYSKHIQPLPINKILNLENVLSELEKRFSLRKKKYIIINQF